MSGDHVHGPRVVALVGPYQTGKTRLLESILCHTGKIHRKAGDETARIFGDYSDEARHRDMGVELNVATTEFMGDRFFFLDCPGSIEFSQDMISALPGVDVAVLVIEPDMSNLWSLAPYLKIIENAGVPHMIFVNKIDKATGAIDQMAGALANISSLPVVLRHVPLRDGEHITGYVDLAQERAYVYHDHAPSDVIELSSDEAERVEESRYALLETLADFDDHLMEELLEDQTPPKTEVFDDLAKDLAEGLITSVFMGSAEHDNGTFRLLKALRHEAPEISSAAARANIDVSGSGPGQGMVAQVLKTFHTAHGGKRSLARIFRGSVAEGATINGDRIGGLTYLHGDNGDRCNKAEAGELVAFGRMENVATGDTLADTSGVAEAAELAPPTVLHPVYDLAIELPNHGDEVKLSGALHKICDEDPAITFRQCDDTHELVLRGQGDMHLKVAVDKLKSRFGLDLSARRPTVPYKETIKKSKTQHSRFKKQSGGHGQFGDIVVDIAPQPLGTGFVFEEKIHGGSVPRQYIPSVETGVKNYMTKGPLGFPVVDLSVTLTDGKYHAVDSSDMAFQQAGRLAMSEALPDCGPVLLEPIMHVKVVVPSAYTAKVNSLVSTRRGQILGFDARPGWSGWDQVEAHMPQSEMHDMIIELRSMTAGSGTFTYDYDHLAELTGRLADQVLGGNA